EVKKKILETSLQSGVVSSLTAYVAINKNTKRRVEGPPMCRDIPTTADIMCSEYAQNLNLHYGHSLHSASHSHHMSANLYILHDHYFDGPEAVWLISLQNADGSWNLTRDSLLYWEYLRAA
ncbi:unnamed protein product, partial [Staurois parvus]